MWMFRCKSRVIKQPLFLARLPSPVHGSLWLCCIWCVCCDVENAERQHRESSQRNCQTCRVTGPLRTIVTKSSRPFRPLLTLCPTVPATVAFRTLISTRGRAPGVYLCRCSCEFASLCFFAACLDFEPRLRHQQGRISVVGSDV
jgi:hypothetical protein